LGRDKAESFKLLKGIILTTSELDWSTQLQFNLNFLKELNRISNTRPLHKRRLLLNLLDSIGRTV
jgi:hypothetical protein